MPSVMNNCSHYGRVHVPLAVYARASETNATPDVRSAWLTQHLWQQLSELQA